jgi:hypothetical protein
MQQACLDVLEGLPALPCATERAWLSVGSDTGAGCSSSAAPGDQEQLAAECAVAATPDTTDTGGGGSSSRTGGSNHQGAALRLQYSQHQLDFLALLMTAVKVLFVGGALDPARRLCALLAPPKSASAAQLHRTTIRNEAAYEGCIQQLLEEHWPATLQQLPQLAEQPVYLLGDSHVLPGGWVQGEGWRPRAVLGLCTPGSCDYRACSPTKCVFDEPTYCVFRPTCHRHSCLGAAIAQQSCSLMQFCAGRCTVVTSSRTCVSYPHVCPAPRIVSW